jgi:hypothetical protein
MILIIAIMLIVITYINIEMIEYIIKDPTNIKDYRRLIMIVNLLHFLLGAMFVVSVGKEIVRFL